MVAVDAGRSDQLEALGAAVWAVTDPASARPRRLLAQSAASLINGLVPLPPQPLDADGLAALQRRGPSGDPLPALVMVGSHVPLADQQLERLLLANLQRNRFPAVSLNTSGAACAAEYIQSLLIR